MQRSVKEERYDCSFENTLENVQDKLKHPIIVLYIIVFRCKYQNPTLKCITIKTRPIFFKHRIETPLSEAKTTYA